MAPDPPRKLRLHASEIRLAQVLPRDWGETAHERLARLHRQIESQLHCLRVRVQRSGAQTLGDLVDYDRLQAEFFATLLDQSYAVLGLDPALYTHVDTEF